MQDFNDNNAETILLNEFVEKSYFDYAMYVILDRALPNIFDGLKPVQRRIVFSMYELGLKANAKYKKSARTVGDVLGKFHPHGDVACYEAMVLMAQSFSYRYPLVDGQGNWGSADDPKSFAAMRYTEAKLSKYSEVLLSELGQGNTDWAQNFDGTLYEPVLLPARLPNMLLNGASGIAVGMATDVPPHNMTEVVNGLIKILDKPSTTVEELVNIIQAPDYPTGSEIVSSKAEILTMYKTGRGSIRQRGLYNVNADEIVIHTVPYQASPAKICQQIAKQMQEKKLPMVVDITDQSDHAQPVCIVLHLRSNRVDTKNLMEHLYASTDLERTNRVNFNIIGVDGRPKVHSLLDFCHNWIEKRKQVVKTRISCRLEKINQRLHILEGLLLVHLNIDEVIKIIRNSDEPQSEIMQVFNLTEVQAKAILEIRLRQLAKLERIVLEKEQSELEQEAQELAAIIAQEKLLIQLIKKELKQDLKEHGDERRSPVVERTLPKLMLDLANKPNNDPVSVVFSKSDWVRSAKGHDLDVNTINFRSGDMLDVIVRAKNTDVIAILDSGGQVFNLDVFGLPNIRSQGVPLTKSFSISPGCEFKYKFLLDEQTEYLIAQNLGFGFISPGKSLTTKLKIGKKIVTLVEGAEILPLINVQEEEYLAIITNTGRMLIIKITDLPRLKKGKGNQLMKLMPQEKIVIMHAFNEVDTLIVKSNRRKLELTKNDWECFLGKRAQRGRFLPSAFRVATNIFSK